MTQPSIIDIDLDDVDPNGITLANTLGAGGALALDGILVVGGVATMDFARQLGVLSAGDDSGDTFTIVGTDADGRALTEAVSGSAGAPGTTETAGYFKTVTSITTSGASTGDVSVGTVDEAVAHTFPLNQYASVAAVINAAVTGTIDYTIEERFDNIQVATGLQSGWVDITAFADKTATVTSNSTRGATAIRIVINSHSSEARLLTNITERLTSL